MVISISEVELRWTDRAVGEDGFELERAPGGSTAFLVIAAPGPNSTSHRDSGLVAGSAYSYRIRAFNARERSPYSGVAIAEMPEARLTVQNLSDLLNGNVSSPVRLAGAPGADGISLREAITAVNVSTAPYEISFAPALMGGTIELLTPLPHIKGRGTRFIGFRSPSDVPGITISAARMNPRYTTLTVAASDVSISNLRFTDLSIFAAVDVLVGPGRGAEAGPQVITDVRIEDNDFDNAPTTATAPAVSIGPSPAGSDTRVSRVTVARNRFHHFQGDAAGVQVAASGIRPVVESVDVVDNTFSACSFPINLVINNSSAGTIRDTRILRNTVTDALLAPITIESNGVEAIGGVITRTLIAGNRISAGREEVIAVVIWGGLFGARGNTVSYVWLHNNILDNHAGGVSIIGGMEGSRDNRVENVQIANSTFYRTPKAVWLTANEGAGDVGNTITGLDVRNSIFWNSEPEFSQEVPASGVSFSLTSAPAFVGRAGNFSADPLFVAPDAGDFRLMPGSPAVDRGTAAQAPPLDMFCHPRVNAPDLGAIELGSSQSACTQDLPALPASLRPRGAVQGDAPSRAIPRALKRGPG